MGSIILTKTGLGSHTDQRWPKSLFQPPTPLLFQKCLIRIQVRIRKIFKFENPTPFQTLAAIDIVGNLPMFSLKKWPRRLLLLPKLKSGSGSRSERKTQNPARVDSGVKRNFWLAKFLTCEISDFTPRFMLRSMHRAIFYISNTLRKLLIMA